MLKLADCWEAERCCCWRNGWDIDPRAGATGRWQNAVGLLAEEVEEAECKGWLLRQRGAWSLESDRISCARAP